MSLYRTTPYLSYRAPRWQKNAINGIERLISYPPVMLRIKDQEIETSQGATIPLDHAPRLWKFIHRVMQSGTPYERNEHTEHDRIDTDGTLTAGCHIISFSEIQRIADQLGFSVPA